MKVSKEVGASHRAALLAAAGRLFRERGFEGVSIAEIAAAAGLTHGAFYTHFASKEALCAETIATAIRQNSERVKRIGDRAARVSSYLSNRHVLDRASGCPLAALGADVGRAAPQVREAFSQALALAIQTLTDERSREDGAVRDRVIVSMSTMLGALVLARGVSDPKLRDEILSAAKRALIGASRS
jgi:TetR/AcrR family transcriptional regulator, transcriptional repressor for nem operon